MLRTTMICLHIWWPTIQIRGSLAARGVSYSAPEALSVASQLERLGSAGCSPQTLAVTHVDLLGSPVFARWKPQLLLCTTYPSADGCMIHG
ncbi:hypothetical protein V8C44DRAFT_104693 [Trichoderma aethiopicum]